MVRRGEKKVEPAKTLQKALVQVNPQTDLYVDLTESLTGVMLIGFLWTHMMFVCTILLGYRVFNLLADSLDRYYLAQIGIPFVILLLFIHIFVAGRRAPWQLQEMKITWRHVNNIEHTDTWIWLGQVITALIIVIMASIHIWVILTQWPITAIKSSFRIDSGYFWFYVLLLFVGEYHAGFGLYRMGVKWGLIKNRRTAGYVMKVITAVIVAFGLVALCTFKQFGGAL
jgi:fumarate reductase subunit C